MDLRTAANDAYAYDPLNRLVTADGTFGSQAFGYDRNANRLSWLDNATTTTYDYAPGSNRLVREGTATVTLDANGNITSQGQRAYTHSPDNRIVSVSEGDALVATYAYNALGQRVSKTVGVITTRFIYGQGGELLAESDATGAVLREYIYLNGAPLAVLDSSGVHYIHTDHLGTPRAATDQTGRLVWRWISDPFGTTAANDDPDGDGTTFTLNLRFPGQYFDTETGLHYNYFRYYDPDSGRYVTSDPIGLAGGLNTYGYVGGDPVGLVDFLGLATIVEDSRTWCFRNPVVCKELYDALPGINPPIPIHATPENGLDIDTSLSDDAQEALDIDADVGCPPNGKDPCKGLRKQLKEHQRKLRQYSKDPLSMDNRGDLRRAIQDGDMARAQIIFNKRVIKLTKQINNFLNQLILCELRHGIR